MAFIGPVITIVIFYNLPAAVGLYWLQWAAMSGEVFASVHKNVSDCSRTTDPYMTDNPT